MAVSFAPHFAIRVLTRLPSSLHMSGFVRLLYYYVSKLLSHSALEYQRYRILRVIDHCNISVHFIS